MSIKNSDSSERSLTVLLAGGGTAGHIEPALAVGEALHNRHRAVVHALGTTKGLDTQIIPARGVELHLIDPVPIPRKQPLKLLGVPVKVLRAVRQACRVIKDTGADVVFGTGGYVSAPAYLAAAWTRVPFYVLETNALSGMANKLGVRLGGVGLNAVDNSGMPGETVGIPVRPGIGEDPDGEHARRARALWGLADSRPVLLVTGGSQGAVSINRAIGAARERLIDDGWQILHAYGSKNEAPEPMEHYHGVAYIEDMTAALAVADLSIGRSGAMTVAEVSASKLPAIYIPLPHGNGEQGRNSAHIVAAGGAVQIPDAEATGDRLVTEIRRMRADDGLARMRQVLEDSGAATVAATIADRIATDCGRAVRQ